MPDKKLGIKAPLLNIDEKVQLILEKGAFMPFLKKFDGFDLELSRQMAQSWEVAKVSEFGCNFVIDASLLVDIIGFSNNGECVTRDKHSLARETRLIFAKNEKPNYEGSGIVKDLLPHP